MGELTGISNLTRPKVNFCFTPQQICPLPGSRIAVNVTPFCFSSQKYRCCPGLLPSPTNSASPDNPNQTQTYPLLISTLPPQVQTTAAPHRNKKHLIGFSASNFCPLQYILRRIFLKTTHTHTSDNVIFLKPSKDFHHAWSKIPTLSWAGLMEPYVI